MKILSIKSVWVLLSVVCFIRVSGTSINTVQDSAKANELILYTIPSFIPLDWSSPASLMESSLDSFIYSRFSKKSYSIGHMIIVLNSPLADSSVKMAMRSTSNREKINLFIRDGVGMGILGAPMQGRLETTKEIEELLDLYQQKEKRKISFMRYVLNEKSTSRVLEFLALYSGHTNTEYQPHKLYGGLFWPRYENEGAGCSAFAIATLEVAGISVNNPEWFIFVNIPGSLVGGSYNNGRRVRGVDIEYAKEWHNGEGIPEKDFFPYKIYDPSKIYNWINAILADSSEFYKPYTIGRVKGLTFDARKIIPDMSEPIILTREQPSCFVSVLKERVK